MSKLYAELPRDTEIEDEPAKTGTPNSVTDSSNYEKEKQLTRLGFVKEFVEIWPQKMPDGHIDYFIAGSLAMNLLSSATEIRDIATGQPIPVTPEICALAEHLPATIKDIDIAYCQNPVTYFRDIDTEEQDRFEVLEKKYHSLNGDPKGIGIDTALEQSVIRTRYRVLTNAGTEYYVTGLDAMVAHKLLSLVRTHKVYSESTNASFADLLNATISVYPEDYVYGRIIEQFRHFRQSRLYDAYCDFCGTLEEVSARLERDPDVSPLVRQMFTSAANASKS